MNGDGLDKVLVPDGHEDYIEYYVFLPLIKYNDTEETLFKLNALIQSLSGDYIWQKEGASLTKCDLKAEISEESKGASSNGNDDAIRPADTDNLVYHGITRFGENIEDEWFVTWILLQLTKSLPDSVVRAVDMDGEYLLIEAADHLPAWAESDSTCRKRVYMYDGKIHLIPLSLEEKGEGVIPKKLSSMVEAVRIIRDHPDLTIASEMIQTSITERIGAYPGKMQEAFHHTNIMVPPLVGAVLNRKPELVAPIVSAFYYRDPDQLSVARRMKRTKPADGLVKRRVRFTKCLYAMLCKQHFRPDVKTGWPYPVPTSPEHKSHSLGAKLTIGFEILLISKCRAIAVASASTSTPKEIQLGKNWSLYVESLHQTGYFKGFLEDSKPFNVLLEKAREFYIQNFVEKDVERNSTDELENIIEQVQHDLQGESSALQGGADGLPDDDDDSWMDLDPETFEALLHKSFKTGDKAPSKLTQLPEKLKKFMDVKAEVEGIDLSTKKLKPGEESELLDPMDFRADDFVSAIDKVLAELGAPDKDWDASDDDDSSYSDEESFVKEISAKHQFKGKNSKIFDIMNQMDEELKGTEIGKTFADNIKVDTDEFDDVEEFEPVDVDINALTNMLKSLQSQDLPTGPSTNLFRSVGLDISMTADENGPTTSQKARSSKSSKQ